MDVKCVGTSSCVGKGVSRMRNAIFDISGKRISVFLGCFQIHSYSSRENLPLKV